MAKPMEMEEVNRPLTELPVGSRRFHRSAFVDYQFNRMYGLGYADPDELGAAARRIRSPREAPAVLHELSAHARAEGRLRHATSYLRGAEFFTPHDSPDKRSTYREYRALFDLAFADVPMCRHEIPYEGGALPAYHLLTSKGSAKHAVLVHGGFDSFIEEFFPIWERIAAAGYDVIAFDGPGQGGARALHGITHDHDWEKPVRVVLDAFGLDRATLVGISMGGYWAMRAAAYEPRIERVVAWPPVYDFMEQVGPRMRRVVEWMLGFPRFVDPLVRLRMRLFDVLEHAVKQANYISGGHEPMDAIRWMLGMNAEHLGSERIEADVLLLAGEHDAFQPLRLARAQERACAGARSVTTRVFTREEHADSHCQIGNLALACRVLTDWLDHGASIDVAPTST